MQDLKRQTLARAVLSRMLFAAPWVHRLPATGHERPPRALPAFTRAGPGRKFPEAAGSGDMAPITGADMAGARPFPDDLEERPP